MGPAAIARALRAWLASVGDPAKRAAFATLIPGARVVGVQVPALRAKAAELRRAHRELPIDAVADVMDRLAASRVREEILVGTFWLARYGRKLSTLPWRRIAKWLPAIDNWETCDQLAMGVAAPVLDADPAPARRLLPLTVARSSWTRRFALATASALNIKGRAHVADTLAVCAPLVADPAPEVRKAVGWALRQATPHDPGAVERFLREHAGTAHPTVMREGSEKLPAARREALSRWVASRPRVAR
jgi:3-methyladenine DNA glycosylase AlkD